MKNNEAYTRHKQRIEKSACNSGGSCRYDRISRERWLQRNEHRKKNDQRAEGGRGHDIS